MLSIAPASPTPEAELRSVLVAVADEKGQPLQGLVREELALLENGIAREVTKVEADQRPLTVALLVDSSAAVGSAFRLDIVAAVSAFLGRLPSGTRFSLWTTGDRPTKLVDYTDDAPAAVSALKRVYPQGGNTLLDALVEASRDLKKQEGARTAVVAVTSLGIDFSSRDHHRAVDDALGNATYFEAVEFEEGPTDFETRTRLDYALGLLTEKTGGILERTLSGMGVKTYLLKIAADLSSHYRLEYATLTGLKNRKIEVKIARPAVRLRVLSQGPQRS
jgi:VWFA-related protein